MMSPDDAAAARLSQAAIANAPEFNGKLHNSPHAFKGILHDRRMKKGRCFQRPFRSLLGSQA
jgi:hypothetical protein